MGLLSAPKKKFESSRSSKTALSVRREKEVTVREKEIPSVGFIIPFQPTMQNIEKIAESFAHTLKSVELQLKNQGIALTDKILERIQKLFSSLNYKTHRKSVAVILSPSEER